MRKKFQEKITFRKSLKRTINIPWIDDFKPRYA